MSDLSPESENINPVVIGRGSFASISVISDRPVAFKHILEPTRSLELAAEFQALSSFYRSCNGDSFFRIPRPLAFYDPESTTFISMAGRISSEPHHGRGSPDSLVNKRDFQSLNFGAAAYAMDRIQSIPDSTAESIRTLFYPEDMRNEPLPKLCRLYFGKVIKERLGPVASRPGPKRFFNSANLPLDASRYHKLVEAADVNDNLVYPSLQNISHGMGEMLGRLHWCAGYDGGDVEFVMGGSSFSGVTMYIIDFNQMRTWESNLNDIQQLVDTFYKNDPYYPRPDPVNALYQEFRKGYLSVRANVANLKGSKDAVTVGVEAFLRAIEEEHRRRI